MRYFAQWLSEDDAGRKDLLMDNATEELSHLEIAWRVLVMHSADQSRAYVSAAAGASTGLCADPAPDPILAAIDAVTRAPTDLDPAYGHHGELEKAFRPVAFYQPKVLVAHYTSQDGPDRGTAYPIHATRCPTEKAPLR